MLYDFTARMHEDDIRALASARGSVVTKKKKGMVTRGPEGPESGRNMRVRGPEGPEDELR